MFYEILHSPTSQVWPMGNGVSYLVIDAGNINLTFSLSLEHTLQIHALSNNLLYVPQVIK